MLHSPIILQIRESEAVGAFSAYPRPQVSQSEPYHDPLRASEPKVTQDLIKSSCPVFSLQRII